MSSNTTGPIVVIPGSGKRKDAERKPTIRARRMSSRLRQGVVLSTLFLVLIASLLTLSPLATGETPFPIFKGIGNWSPIQQLIGQLQPHAGESLPPDISLPHSQYVAIAQQDAIDAGIPSGYFVRQINAESGFNPNSVSPAGAVGIAQFLPDTAAGLGIDPWNPSQALRGAARLMASYTKQYGGDYAKALAAYNGGTGTIHRALTLCGSNWLNCLPAETRNYIYIIMGI